MDVILEQQKAKCAKFGAPFEGIPLELKIGVSRGFLQSKSFFNGLRHPPEGGTSGWYLWGKEEMLSDDDFFLPLHAVHLIDRKPEVLPYLGLAPGWRFLTDGITEDIWFDQALLDIS